MAKIDSPIPFKGKWGGMTVYHLRGVGLVGREHSGPSAHDVRTKDHFLLTRLYGNEHGGCSRASRYLRRNFHPLAPARDYVMSGPVTGWMKAFLPYDTQSALGQRHILLSQAPRLLEGINLSKRHPFDTVVKGGLTCTLNREERSAAVEVPDLLPGVGFIPASRQPYFKVVAALGMAPDMLWSPQGYTCAPEYDQIFPVAAESEWMPTVKGGEAFSLALQLPYTPPDEQFALVLTVGVLMGTAGHRGGLEAVKYAGCAKLLAAG